MGVQTIMVSAFALLALLLLVAVFQLKDRPGEPPARKAFQAMFVIHFLLFVAFIAVFALPDSVLAESLVDGCLAAMYTAMALGTKWRSRSALPVGLVVAAGLAYFVADAALPGVQGLRVGTLYIAGMNGLCAALIWRRPGGPNAGDVVVGGICAGWALVNLTALSLTFTTAPEPEAAQEVLVLLLALSPAFFAGYGVFLVVSYMLDVQKDLIELSIRDPLTGLHNRRHLADRSREIFKAATRRRERVSLIELDIDGFKSINDTHGHHAGDLVLKTTASVLVEQTRAEDVVARVGGEEFVVLMQGVDHAGAVAVAERIRTAIARMPTHLKGVRLGCTASLGVVSALAGDTSYESVLGEADTLLYRAKQQGKNRIAGSDLGNVAPLFRDHPPEAGAERAERGTRESALSG